MLYKARSEDAFASLATRPWEQIIMHHTFNPPGESLECEHLTHGEELEFVSSIDRAHREYRGWKNGLGYHGLIFPSGSLWYGKRWKDQLLGAHTKGHNDSIGLCFFGNFMVDEPTEEQVLTFALTWLSLEKKLNKKLTMDVHRSFKNTACPGALIDDDVLADIGEHRDFLSEANDVYDVMEEFPDDEAFD